ncbi:MAG: transcription termination factor NusA [Armatimonadetes bacterium]|nr:transcription termination factor NusA [Armatimonadota bacterium]
MNGEFLEALQQIAKERELAQDQLIETVEAALVHAYRKTYATSDNVQVRVDSSRNSFHVFCRKTVVENISNEHSEISLEEARKIDGSAEMGQVLEVEVTPSNFGRIAAQTAKQVVVQRIREAEREKIFEEYNQRTSEVLTGTVQRREHRNVFIALGKIEAILPPQEQVSSEPYRFNDRLKVYLLEARRTTHGPVITVSRTHPSLIRRLFELEVPEISDGTVTIKSVAREPGARSKIAVYSRDDKVDPVGSCVGHRGSRVQAVVNELYGEKIDIVRWSADSSQFIGEALSPAKTVRVTLDEENKSALVIVPDNQLSLAIGKSGQNVRLAARLTGWRIDIRSEAQIARATLMAATSEPLSPEDELEQLAHPEPENGLNSSGPDGDTPIVDAVPEISPDVTGKDIH